MKHLNSPWLDLDQMIKVPTLHPYQLSRIDKAVLHINHNPAVHNKLALLPAINHSMDFTNQYPALNTATSSFASFNVRKGMQLSLITTIRRSALLNLYYKLLFQIYPKHLNSIDTSIADNIFLSLPKSGNFHLGLTLAPRISGNLVFVLTSYFDLKPFYLSYWNFPIKATLA